MELEKSLLSCLKKREISLRKMIEKDDAFISSYFGSSSTGGGHLNYTEEQMQVLFASVPRIFSYDFNTKNYDELTEKQSTVLEIIHEIKGHPAYLLSLSNIPKIISTAKFYSDLDYKRLKELNIKD